MTNDEAPRAYMPQSPPLPATFYYNNVGAEPDSRAREMIIAWQYVTDDRYANSGWWPVIHSYLSDDNIAANTRRALGQKPNDLDDMYYEASPAHVVVGIPFDIHYPDA